jgi:hypothetical protein
VRIGLAAPRLTWGGPGGGVFHIRSREDVRVDAVARGDLTAAPLVRLGLVLCRLTGQEAAAEASGGRADERRQSSELAVMPLPGAAAAPVTPQAVNPAAPEVEAAAVMPATPGGLGHTRYRVAQGWGVPVGAVVLEVDAVAAKT